MYCTLLDEPSIGLHQRDNDRLIDTLKGLRNLGNTLLVVEHDEDTMRAADYLVDIGPVQVNMAVKFIARYGRRSDEGKRLYYWSVFEWP